MTSRVRPVSGSVVRPIILACTVIVAMTGFAQAGTLVYTPTNPTFGGNPLNGSNLFNSAQAQNQFTQSGSSGSGGLGGALTPGQIFAQQLTSQLYSSLANQITQQIFGSSATTGTGTFTFGGTTITYTKNPNGTIDITINDGQTITQVSVPAPPTGTH
ncbi:curli assembly protein CsgF [Bradyrhizobium sp. SYSU BS000235]|uniref:curli assembly protein CsgF n=1 Tax=Bradyrhizobium sp. SYSU BS000235 TaxID=3411332 RepID=UPI003C7844B7